jgi:hypothetical protein
MKTIPFLAIALCLGGCAAYDGHTLRAGASEAEVRSVMGAPAVEYSDPDGSKVLAYPRGPMGSHTYMARVSKDGTLEGVRQALTDGTFNRIRPGETTREDILRLIGPPGETMFFKRLNQDSWGYRYKDDWGYLAIFSVNFDANGVVASKFSRRIDRPSLF